MDVLVATAVAGGVARLAGPPGSGRTRCLDAAADHLAAAGHSVNRPAPARLPFQSVLPLLPTLTLSPDADLSTVSARVAAALGDLLRSAVLVIDDVTALDRWSREALAGVGGPMLTTDPVAQGRTVALAPLAESDLRALFHGPDLLLHLQEDGARELFARTEGLPARVREETAAWVRAGLARWEDRRLAIDRTALDSLATGIRLAPVWVSRSADLRASGPVQAVSFSGAQVQAAPHRELLAWASLAWPHGTAPLLAAATGEPLWSVEARLHELRELGLVVIDGHGAAVPTAASQRHVAFSEDQRRYAHARVAASLPSGTDSRLRHLVAAGDEATVVAETLLLIAHRRSTGAHGRAMAAAIEGLAAARAAGDGAGEAHLLDELARLALADGTPASLDRALYELGRTALVSPDLRSLDALLRLALTSSRELDASTVARAGSLPPFEDPELECARHDVRVRAARGATVEHERQVLAEALAWSRAIGTELARTRALLWQGIHLYRQARYEEAAVHQRSATDCSAPVLRLTALLDLAASLLEAGRHADAEEAARAARAQAARLRHAMAEGQAAWIVRTAAYRLGRPLPPDLELVAAAEAVGVAHLIGQVCLTEAAFALRAADTLVASSLARRASSVWRRAGRRWESSLTDALAAAPEPQVPPHLLPDALACPIEGFGVQILGLIALVSGPRPEWQERAQALAAGVPAERQSIRIDVLSVEESLLAVYPGSQPGLPGWQPRR